MSAKRVGWVVAVAALAVAASPGSARAQWGYPGGYGAWGWGGWGGGETVQGSVARGLGAYAAGAGYYNLQTAQATSINADTVMRWNQYWWESQVAANRAERQRIAARAETVNKSREAIEKRLRENPEPRDIYSGDALNLAVEEITNPSVYTKALQAAKTRLPGMMVRDIPFTKASAAITTSIHQISQGPPPASLMTADFASDRAAIKAAGAKIRAAIEEGKTPDPVALDEILGLVHNAETKVDKVYPRNSREHNEAARYLKALHGLLAMLKTPALDVILAGVESRPEVSMGELLNFMGAFDLRFGPATTPQQRLAYDRLFPTLDAMRDQVAEALASASAPKSSGAEPGEFFSGMSYDDLKKKAPAPNPPK